MLIIATQKYTRQTARKTREVANAVRKMPLPKAIEQLSLIERKSSLVVLKTLRQAIANAKHNHNLDLADLTLNNILIEAGPVYKRFRAVSRGRAHSILKRTCHVKVILQSNVAKTTAVKKTESIDKVKAVKTVESSLPVEKEPKKTQATQQEIVKSQQKVTATKAVQGSGVKQTRTKNLGGRK